MATAVSKSRFKPRVLEFLRNVEATGEPLIITDRGRPVLKILPFQGDANDDLSAFRNAVLRFDDPLSPVGLEDWKHLK